MDMKTALFFSMARGIMCAVALMSCSLRVHASGPDSTAVRTLFGGGADRANGGWGAPTVHYTSIMGQDALLVGARGGWLIDHRLTLGFAGHGLVTNVTNPAFDGQLYSRGDSLFRESQFRMGYGGFLIEPIIAPFSPVHVSLPILIGAGGATYQTYRPNYRPTSGPDGRDEDYSDDVMYAQAFFVMEAGVDLEVNLVPLVRLGLGASYRYTSDLHMPATPKDALHGWNFGLSVKVGRF